MVELNHSTVLPGTNGKVSWMKDNLPVGTILKIFSSIHSFVNQEYHACGLP